MGHEQSSPIDESVSPETLESRTIEAVAKYIKDGRQKRIVVMTGAGISTSAGIPDFRSPETGLYANLARLNLPYAEAVFDISYFRKNPLPFYTLARELYPGKFRPTITHSFIRLLYDKGLLLKAFTQNIDCLEREAGVPGEMMIEAHGSFARQRCIDCKKEYPDDLMHLAIENLTVPHCLYEDCGGLVKPDIVFFGEELPADFFDNRDLPLSADLCIVMGTSLSVQPFASLPEFCATKTPRVLINKERVGNMGSRADDVLILTDCDDGVRKLAEACGWLEELEELWTQTTPAAAKERQESMKAAAEAGKNKTKDEKVADEVEKLTKQVEEALKLSKDHQEALKEHTEPVKEPVESHSKSATISSTSKAISNGTFEGGSLYHVFPYLAKKPSL